MNHKRNINSLLDRDFDSFAAGTYIPEERSSPITGEQHLYIAVLRQAIVDATSPETTCVDPHMRSKLDIYRRQARAVIFSNATVTAEYFKAVCELAGVEVSVVRRRVKDMIRNQETIDDPS